MMKLTEALESFQYIHSILKGGGVIAVPTDTIYGLACLCTNESAVKKIYDIKGRNACKPLAICVGSVDAIKKWSKPNLTDVQLLDLLPGPVTVVFKRSKLLPVHLNSHIDKIGIRVPNHEFLIRFCQYVNVPLALTSANVSDEESSLDTEDFRHLWPKIDLVIDGGTIDTYAGVKTGSTVVDLSSYGKYRILRAGIQCDEIDKYLSKTCGLERSVL